LSLHAWKQLQHYVFSNDAGGDPELLTEYLRKRNWYKEVRRNSKKEWNEWWFESLRTALNGNDYKEVWCMIRGTNTQGETKQNIPTHAWVEHFRQILGSRDTWEASGSISVCLSNTDPILDKYQFRKQS